MLPGQHLMGALPHPASNPAVVHYTLHHPLLLPSHWALLLLLLHM
jgi:hypothetical protein